MSDMGLIQIKIRDLKDEINLISNKLTEIDNQLLKMQEWKINIMDATKTVINQIWNELVTDTLSYAFNKKVKQHEVMIKSIMDARMKIQISEFVKLVDGFAAEVACSRKDVQILISLLINQKLVSKDEIIKCKISMEKNAEFINLIKETEESFKVGTTTYKKIVE